MFFGKELTNLDVEKIVESQSVVLGLDIGSKTLGVAVSDRRLMIATGLKTLTIKNNNFSPLLELVKEYKVGAVVFGWPVQMNGIPGEQCEKIAKTAEIISQYLHVEFFRWDERLSTCAVEQVLLSADLSRAKRSRIIDKTAAVYILQGALDAINMRRS